MRYLSLFFLICWSQSAAAQHRVNKLSVNFFTNLYTRGSGHLNKVVRLSENAGFSFKTYDTLKKRGMIYELLSTNTTAYYKNVLGGGNILEVADEHLNLNFIFPMLISTNGSLEHSLGVGVGVGTLAYRDYYNENDVVLPYDEGGFKKLKFGNYWTTALLIDYEFSMKWSKRVGLNLGLRYATPVPIRESNLGYDVSQGTGIAFKYGVFYQFK
ncbi:MAG: hypothetical protein WKF70_04780 [Chitinophagaceae bacterium]